eukprot:94731_1
MYDFHNVSFILTLINCLINLATSAWCQLYLYSSADRGGTQWGPMDINSCWNFAGNFNNDVASSAWLQSINNYACTAIFYNHCDCGGGAINPSETLTVPPYNASTINFGPINNQVSCITITAATPNPTAQTATPTKIPTMIPTTLNPTFYPTSQPTKLPTIYPSILPTTIPTNQPSFHPSIYPTNEPTFQPTVNPTNNPTYIPTYIPTVVPTFKPTEVNIVLSTSTITDFYVITTQFVIERSRSNSNVYMLWIVIIACLILCCICAVIVWKFGLYENKQNRFRRSMSTSAVELAPATNNTDININSDVIAEYINTNTIEQPVKQNNTIIQECELSSSSSSTDIINEYNTRTDNGHTTGIIIKESIDEQLQQKVTVGMNDESNYNIADDEFIIQEINELPLDNSNDIGESQQRRYSEGPKHDFMPHDTAGQ